MKGDLPREESRPCSRCTRRRGRWRAQIGRVTFEHVRRELNKDADRLANEAMDEAAATPDSQPPTPSV